MNQVGYREFFNNLTMSAFNVQKSDAIESVLAYTHSKDSLENYIQCKVNKIALLFLIAIHFESKNKHWFHHLCTE